VGLNVMGISRRRSERRLIRMFTVEAGFLLVYLLTREDGRGMRTFQVLKSRSSKALFQRICEPLTARTSTGL